jgi:hypothetical protein
VARPPHTHTHSRSLSKIVRVESILTLKSARRPNERPNQVDARTRTEERKNPITQRSIERAEPTNHVDADAGVFKSGCETTAGW